MQLSFEDRTQIQQLSDALGVTIPFDTEAFAQKFLPAFKNACIPLIPFGQTRYLAKNAVNRSLENREVRFSFRAEEKVWDFRIPYFYGRLIDEDSIRFKDLNGEVTINYWGNASVTDGKSETRENVDFDVSYYLTF
jgi:hypothetical protein